MKGKTRIRNHPVGKPPICCWTFWKSLRTKTVYKSEKLMALQIRTKQKNKKISTLVNKQSLDPI